MMRERYYRLNGREVVRCDFDYLLDNMRGLYQVIARDQIGNIVIRTVFTSADQSWLPFGPPLVFETMVLGGAHDLRQIHCSTYDEAEANHREMVNKMRKLANKDQKGG